MAMADISPRAQPGPRPHQRPPNRRIAALSSAGGWPRQHGACRYARGRFHTCGEQRVPPAPTAAGPETAKRGQPEGSLPVRTRTSTRRPASECGSVAADPAAGTMLAGAAIDPDASERDDVEAEAPTASSALSLLREIR